MSLGLNAFALGGVVCCKRLRGVERFSTQLRLEADYCAS